MILFMIINVNIATVLLVMASAVETAVTAVNQSCQMYSTIVVFKLGSRDL